MDLALFNIYTNSGQTNIRRTTFALDPTKSDHMPSLSITISATTDVANAGAGSVYAGCSVKALSNIVLGASDVYSIPSTSASAALASASMLFVASISWFSAQRILSEIRSLCVTIGLDLYNTVTRDLFVPHYSS